MPENGRVTLLRLCSGLQVSSRCASVFFTLAAVEDGRGQNIRTQFLLSAVDATRMKGALGPVDGAYARCECLGHEGGIEAGAELSLPDFRRHIPFSRRPFSFAPTRRSRTRTVKRSARSNATHVLFDYERTCSTARLSSCDPRRHASQASARKPRSLPAPHPPSPWRDATCRRQLTAAATSANFFAARTVCSDHGSATLPTNFVMNFFVLAATFSRSFAIRHRTRTWASRSICGACHVLDRVGKLASVGILAGMIERAEAETAIGGNVEQANKLACAGLAPMILVYLSLDGNLSA